MNGNKVITIAVAISALQGIAVSAHAKATAEEIGRLGKDLTCMGAEKAGTTSGVAEFTGKWMGPAPGMPTEPGKHPVDPYASEKPLFTITAQNLSQYADKLSEGQKAMFKKYPKTFTMQVYPSHRDFRYDDTVCKVIAQNAAEAELAADGQTVPNGRIGAPPFPFPKSGLEAIWNGTFPPTVNVEHRDEDMAIVYANGNITWGNQLMWQYSRRNDPKVRGQKYDNSVSAYVRLTTVQPEREKGSITVTLDNFTMAKGARQVFQYIPATRRVRQAPEFGFDIPIPATSNTLVVDEVRMYNGSGERYNWKVVGKKEVYIPYNNFKLESKAAGENHYANLIKPNHPNPEFVRWELHRVWVIEGKLKEGYRHLYPSRTLYADEDSWLYVMSDIYDAQNTLWRFNWINNFYLPGARTFAQGSAFYHDLIAGNYTAYDLTAGKSSSLIVDKPGVEYANPEYYAKENMK